MIYGSSDLLIVVLVSLPAFGLWLVTLVRLRRATDPRDADGRRVEVDEQRLLAAQRLHRWALIALVVATGASLALRVVL